MPESGMEPKLDTSLASHHLKVVIPFAEPLGYFIQSFGVRNLSIIKPWGIDEGNRWACRIVSRQSYTVDLNGA